MSIVDPLRRAPARQCRKIKPDRLGSELGPAQIDPSREAALAIRTAESTLQPGDRLVPKRRIILVVVDKGFPERKSPMPEKAEPAFLFGQVAPDVTPGDVIPPICRQCRCLCGEAKMGPLDFDKPAMMVKPDLWKIAKEVLGENPLFLGEDFANSRRGLDVPGFPDPAQLAANGDRVAHVFEEVRANNEVERLVGECPVLIPHVLHDPGIGSKTLVVFRIEGIVEATRLVGIQVDDMGGEIERSIPSARIEDARRPPSNLSQLRQVRTQDHRSFGKDASGPTIRISPSTGVVNLNNLVKSGRSNARSGSHATTSSAVTTRSLAAPWFPRSAKMSMPPAISTSSETHPMPEINGSAPSFHS